MITAYTRPKVKLSEIAAWFCGQGMSWPGTLGGLVFSEYNDDFDCIIWVVNFHNNQLELAAHFKLVFG